MKTRAHPFLSILAVLAILAMSVGVVNAGAGGGNSFNGATSTSSGYSTWDSDIINVEKVSQTGAGVYVAVLDTGLVPNWRDYFPEARIATQLGTGFDQSVTFKAHSTDACGLETEVGALRQNTWVGSTGSTHGTHVASTIIGYFYRSNTDAAQGFPLPPIMVRGIAPEATIIPVKVLADYQVPARPKCTDPNIDTTAHKAVFGTSEMVAAGINYVTDLAIAGYRPMVINMSLGGDALEPVEKAAIDRAVENGVIVVAAAGNEGETGMSYPGAYAPVISAGAAGWTKEWLKPTDGLPRYRMWWLKYPNAPMLPNSGEVADPTAAGDVYVTDFSSRALPGQELDVLAPGSWVRGPFPGDPGYSHLPWWSKGIGDLRSGHLSNFFYVGGTSMATPHVASAAALLLQTWPDLQQADVESILKDTALPIPSTGSQSIWDNTVPATMAWDIDCAGTPCDPVGAGLIQLDAALAPTVNAQFLAVNDFHGNLEPPAGSSGRIGVTNAGGAEYLATHIGNLRATNPKKTVVVSAGDMIGASPLLSALFHDEPTIEAFNLMGLEVNAVGNHEFDEGAVELSRMQNGGCHPTDGCLDGDGFAGAKFSYLAANVVWNTGPNAGQTLFAPYKIRRIAGVKVAFIGMTLKGTPTIVTPSGVAGLDFLDEADTVNALVPELQAQGVNAIVVLVHEGGAQSVALSESTINTCTGMSGPIVDIVNRLDPAVDMVISGHTHNAYNCNINGKLVTSGASFGRLVTDVTFTLDRNTGDFTTMAANNVIVTRTVAKNSLMTALIAKYNAIAAPLANRIIGSITANITRTGNAAGESALGDVIADAQLDATNDPGFGDAVVAFMNPGGIRADFTYAGSPAGEGDGNVTYGEMFTVQPFGNSMVTLTLTGAQIERVLEEQLPGCTLATARILQVSAGFAYTWKASGGVCDKVDPATIMLNGIVINPAANYRVTVNSFLADGGDSFPTLKLGTDRLGGEVDTDALEKYFVAHSPVAPGPQNRITVVP